MAHCPQVNCPRILADWAQFLPLCRGVVRYALPQFQPPKKNWNSRAIRAIRPLRGIERSATLMLSVASVVCQNFAHCKTFLISFVTKSWKNFLTGSNFSHHQSGKSQEVNFLVTHSPTPAPYESAVYNHEFLISGVNNEYTLQPHLIRP